MNLYDNAMYQALKAHYEAERKKAYANMQVFMNSPMGVAEHPDILETMLTHAEKLAHAEDVLRSLEKNFE